MQVTLQQPTIHSRKVHLVELGSRLAGSRRLVYPFFTLLYFVPTYYLAHLKLIWDDEFFTLYLSRIASWHELIRALNTGADQHPPSFYYLTHGIFQVFGTSHFTLRLPAILGFWLLCVCLFEIVKTMANTFWAVVAMLFPLTTSFYYYSTEARGYGLVLGFAALSLLCWLRATEFRRRRAFLPLLAFSLAATVASHYYALLVVACLVIGEAFRTLTRRRLDLPVWIAFVFAFVPILVFYPTIQHARGYSTHFWAVPSWPDALIYYKNELGSGLVPLAGVFALIVCLEYTFTKGELRAIRHRDHPPLNHWQIAAIVALGALPVPVMIAAKFFTHGFSDRYAISAVIGVAVLLTCVLHRLFPRPRAALAAILTCLTMFGYQIVKQRGEILNSRDDLAIAVDLLKRTGNEPVALMGITPFHQISFYAPRQIASRITYVSDPASAIRYLGHDTVDRGLLDLGPWFPLKVVPLRPYLNQHPHFLAYGGVDSWEWLSYDLPQWGETKLLSRRYSFLLLSLTAVHSVPDPDFAAESTSDQAMLYHTLPSTGVSLCQLYMSSGQCPEDFVPASSYQRSRW